MHRLAHYPRGVLKIVFGPRSLLTLAVSLTVATLFVILSVWQLGSSTQANTTADPAKDRVTALTQVIQPGEVTTVRRADWMVRVPGQYVPGSTVLVPNRYQDGVRGYWVVSQLEVAESEQLWEAADGPVSVTVARGWVESSDSVPEAPSEDLTVAGRFLPPEAPLGEQDLPDRQLSTVSPAQLTNRWDAPLYSGYIAASAEVPANAQLPLTDQNTLAETATVLGQNLRGLDVDQQPTTNSVDVLNLFYALEWVVFAGFAVFIWWRFVRDEYERQKDPQEYFYMEGDYFWDEAEQSLYYWDDQDQRYYYFDDQPAAKPQSPAATAARRHTYPEHGATHE